MSRFLCFFTSFTNIRTHALARFHHLTSKAKRDQRGAQKIHTEKGRTHSAAATLGSATREKLFFGGECRCMRFGVCARARRCGAWRAGATTNLSPPASPCLPSPQVFVLPLAGARLCVASVASFRVFALFVPPSGCVFAPLFSTHTYRLLFFFFSTSPPPTTGSFLSSSSSSFVRCGGGGSC